MKTINSKKITDTVASLCIDANICIGEGVRRALIHTRERETSKLALFALDVLIENAEIAKRERLPICQDTGMVVVFVDIGSDVHIDGNIEEAINEGVSLGYSEGYLRNSVVGDPVIRTNTGDNTPAVIHYDFTTGNSIKITVAPKGFGSENMSALSMLTPSDGIEGVEDFIVSSVERAGGCPCPPVIVGVGVGGTMEKAAILSKRALLREVGKSNKDQMWADVETRLLSRINALGIGSCGFGGDITALGVHIETYPTHIAGLPVAVNIGCHATRHCTKVL